MADPSNIPTAFVLPNEFTVDVHTHPIPEILIDALVSSGHTATPTDGLVIHGFTTPPWDIETYMKGRDKLNCHFSILSITAPGLSFLAESHQAEAATLARELNENMASLIAKYPSRLGAFGILPVPEINDSVKEIAYCLDTLEFEGIGLYTNYNGVYLGAPSLDPILRELNLRKATVFVHPTSPDPQGPTIGLGAPAMEYPFDTTRAITNLVLNDAVTKFPEIKFIFSHGGGTLPYLADRLAGIMQIPLQGGKNAAKTTKIFKGFYFDLASSCSQAQLSAITALVNPSHLLIGTDVPYFPDMGVIHQEKLLASFGFTDEQLKMIRHGNAVSLFPKLLEKLDRLSRRR